MTPKTYILVPLVQIGDTVTGLYSRTPIIETKKRKTFHVLQRNATGT